MENYENNNYQPVEPVVENYAAPAPNGKGLSIASFVCGLTSLIGFLACCCCAQFYIPLILAVVAVILGIVALVKKQDKRGFAIAGIVLGAIVLLLVLIFFIAAMIMGPEGIIELMRPMLEQQGVDVDQLKEMVESGASSEEITDFINEQMEAAGTAAAAA